MNHFTLEHITNIPPNAGRAVGICNFRDRIIVACERGLYELNYDYLRDYYRLTPLHIDFSKVPV